ncbi:hypothetical protein Scep_022585 [Stephania cephalantha]|uniref:NAC domain-containing protein n=1 Tax=Stephania cephalantha TaxID=152367 RepID=A0AAP0F5Q0_9MAGN
MDNLPPGFRFHPTDEELITYYLTRKVSDFCFVTTAIGDVDLNKCEPWDLPAKATMGEKEWYFFNLRDRKYPTGLRTNRATDAGYWKTTGKDKEIFHCGVLVGLKKTLVFYKGRAPKGVKSNWVMHEYRLESKFSFKSTKFGEIEMPINSNCLTNSSSGLNTYSNSNQSNNDTGIDMNMSWASTRGTPSHHLPALSWPSTLLTSNVNASVNSLLLRAFQLGGYQARETTSSSTHDHLNSLLVQGDYRVGADLNATFPTSSSSTNVVDMNAQQQSFNQDLMWRNYLNNLPEDYVRDGKQLFVDGSTIITTEASDTSERETETLNRARQLVFGNDNLPPQPSPHLGLSDLSLGGAQPGSFHHHHQSGSNITINGGDPSSLPYRSVYPTTTRLFSSSSGSSSPNILSPPAPPQTAPYPYASPSPQSRMVSFPHQVNDYYVGHVLTGSSNRHHHQLNPSSDSTSYTCIGAPLGRDFGQAHGDGSGIRSMDLSTRDDDSMRSWDRSSYGSTTQCVDPPLINRFHDRF